jgi:hypothetical protein
LASAKTLCCTPTGGPVTKPVTWSPSAQAALDRLQGKLFCTTTEAGRCSGTTTVRSARALRTAPSRLSESEQHFEFRPRGSARRRASARMPETTERRPLHTDGAPDNYTSPAAKIPSQPETTADVTRRARRAIQSQPRRVAPLAPASVFPPGGRRRLWMFTYGCKICGTHSLGRARDVDGVTGLRRASCGHWVRVMAARIYSAPEAAA